MGHRQSTQVQCQCEYPETTSIHGTYMLTKLPSHLQACRQYLHLEIDKQDVDWVKHLVKNAKKEGLYKTMWVPHAHVMEVLDWDTSPGEVKRHMKFMKKLPITMLVSPVLIYMGSLT